MKNKLGGCDDLFLRYFDPWYTEEARRRRSFKATMPDMLTNEQLIGIDPASVTPLTDAAQEKALKQIERMINAAKGDWPGYLHVSEPVDLHWIEAFDRYFDRNRVGEIIAHSDDKHFGNDYLVLCCEFGAVLAYVMQELLPRFMWYPDLPYWDSMLIDPKTGTAIPVFHWAIKKMSGSGIDDGYVSKINQCLQLIEKSAI